MAKRNPSKPSKRKAPNKYGISERSYETLKRNAQNARKRLTTYTNKHGVSPDLPTLSDLTIDALIERYKGGESLAKINASLRGLTAERFAKITTVPIVTGTGYTISTKDYNQLRNAVNRANRNISAARSNLGEFADIAPKEFDLNQIVRDIVNAETLKNQLNDLRLFTPKNLKPVAINSSGEAGTVAEDEYLKRIIKRENERRAKLREENDPRKNEGFFVQQDEVNTRDIDLSKLDTRERLRKRAENWTDAKRVARANQYLKNYEESLDTALIAMQTTVGIPEHVQKSIDEIKQIIAQLYNNEDAVTYLVHHVPELEIAIVSGAVLATIPITPILNSWVGVKDMFL